jgi:3-hydroxypropanoate dehydrogenase
MVLDDAALDTLFRTAHTTWDFTDEPVTDDDLKALYELVKLGPTSANCSPARFVFVRTPEGKEKLRPVLSAGNLEKTMAAPLTVIVAQDPFFFHHLPRLFPTADAKSWFSGNPDLADDTATRNSTLQGAYFILAARALGLACGPMSGFDKVKVERAFFPSSGWKANFLINLGYAKPVETPAERLPKLSFEEATLFA